jgi:hypothetical protein
MCGQQLNRIYAATSRFLYTKPAIFDVQKLNALDKVWKSYEKRCVPYLLGHCVVPLEKAISKSDLSKDAGAPWNMIGIGSKKQFLERTACVEALNSFWEQLPNKIPKLLTQVNGKDELLSAKKLSQGRQRVIYAMCAMHFFCLAMMSFDFCQRIAQNPMYLGMALFLTPTKGGSQRMASHLDKHKYGFSVDFGKMDGSVSELEVRNFIRLFCNLMKDKSVENVRRFTNLMLAVVYTVLVLPDGNCYYKGFRGEGGNLSGQYLTAILNTFCVITRFMYVWKRLGFKLSEFWNNVAPLVLGDDVIATVSKEYYDKGYRIERIAYLLFDDFSQVVEFTSPVPKHYSELPFLSFILTWDQEFGQWGISVDIGRVISSIKQGPNKGRKNTTLEEQCRLMQRLCSIRTSTWTDPVARELLNRMCLDYMELHKDNRGYPQWDNALTGFHTDTELASLWYGFQAGTGSGAMSGIDEVPLPLPLDL